MKRQYATLGLALLVLMAGCLGGLTGQPANDADTAPGDDDAIEPSGDTQVSGDSGSINFYISDEPNAIGDFEHLNVTITKVGVHKTGDDGETATSTATATETATPDNETDTATATETATATATEAGDDADDGDDGDEAKAGWVEYEVNKTVDLTELVGANATKLGVLDAPEGEYDAVFIYVSEINATLTNGESVNVKLPSEKLQIHKQFAVENGSEVDFVFDIAVHKAGGSGKYILKPVISQSGTGDDVDIDDVDEKKGGPENGEDADENETDEAEDAGPSDLEASLQGNVAPGNDVKLQVTGADGPVEGATVTVNGEEIGQTAADGTIGFTVPDAEELEITVVKGDAETELERDLSSGGGDGNGQGDNPALAPLASA